MARRSSLGLLGAITVSFRGIGFRGSGATALGVTKGASRGVVDGIGGSLGNHGMLREEGLELTFGGGAIGEVGTAELGAAPRVGIDVVDAADADSEVADVVELARGEELRRG